MSRIESKFPVRKITEVYYFCKPPTYATVYNYPQLRARSGALSACVFV